MTLCHYVVIMWLIINYHIGSRPICFSIFSENSNGISCVFFSRYVQEYIILLYFIFISRDLCHDLMSWHSRHINNYELSYSVIFITILPEKFQQKSGVLFDIINKNCLGSKMTPFPRKDRVRKVSRDGWLKTRCFAIPIGNVLLVAFFMLQYLKIIISFILI